MQIFDETIYQYIYAKTKGELKKQLLKYLKYKDIKNKNRKLSHKKRGQISNLIPIYQKSEELEERKVPGYWEANLIMGKNNKTALGVLVERTSRFVFMVPLKGKKASDLRESFFHQFMDVDEKMKLSLTYDRGKAMVQHKQFTENTGVDVYFADPHSPWKKGSCENTNALIRDFFPKETSFSKVTYEELKHAQNLLNGRPRKTLGWKTPEEVFYKLIGVIKT